MKKKTISIITSVIGFIAWLSIIPLMIFMDDDRLIMALSLATLGAIAIYFKNDSIKWLVNDLMALAKNHLSKFNK